ncbi:LysR family transcriptional regulator [Telmatospirillum siberiense]|uniref:LysR family transcriptional regulator n=1 Tax=Telmatospirillum siberiense TaxID=382514 RepID=A0A2N3PYJ3_9PROT|nr:LysR family transcriptional regulator [Telmatospirillum siberiense]PKU25469.1 LysR family transcriptional regulator [Telmatospirillum siberiense]
MDPYRLGLVSPRIHYFQLVARLGSIRQVAQMLNVAPSSISRVIKSLEEELGTRLFERVRQRLKLTSAGELLLYHARASSAELNRAWSEINELHGLHRGTVSVAVIESVARGLIPAVLQEFWARHPHITVDVKVAGSQQVCDLVTAGDCDLAVAFDVRVPRNVRKAATAQLPLGVLARPDSRFAGKKELKLFDLSGERVIVSDSSLTLGISVEDAFSRSLIDLARRSRTNSIGLMVDMAKMNLGTVLQTRVGIENEIAEGSLTFIPLRDPKISPRRLMLLARSEKEMSDAASAFAALLAQAIERLKR